jgi:valyl-tRNA synthetase
MEPYFLSMAGARPTAWGPEVQSPRLSANVALTGMEVFVDLADLIDVPAEIERKKQEIAKLDGLVTGKRKKLENKNFVDRAPAAVVQGERDSLKDLEEQLAAAKAVLERLTAR